MENYRLTKKADADLSAIYEYGLLNFGLNQAQSYLLGLYDRFQQISNNPLSGQEAPLLHPGLRKLSYQSHIIFYLYDTQGILIARILRQEMDATRHL